MSGKIRCKIGSKSITSLLLCFIIAASLFMACWSNQAKAQEKPVYGGTVVTVLYADPVTLNPDITTNFACHYIVAPVYERLVKYNLDGTKILPVLAQSWDVSTDGLKYTFHLVKNATWHDGEPFTSADVKYTWENVLSKYVVMYTTIDAGVESVATPDDYTVVFNLKYPMPYLLPMFPYYGTYILPKHLYEGTDPLENEYNWKPVGTGPFKFEEYVKGSHCNLVKNPNYWRSDLPYLDKLVYRIMPDRTARKLAIDTLEADNLPYWPEHLESVGRWQDDPDISVTQLKSLGGSLLTIYIQNEKPPLDDRRVRQALALATNKTFLSEKAAYGLTPPGVSVVMPHWLDYYNPDAAQNEYDIDKANQLLDDAGYPKGTDGMRDITLSLIYDPTNPVYVGTSEAFQGLMRENIGVDIQLTPLETAVFYGRLAGDFELGIWQGSMGPDPTVGLGMYWSENIKDVYAFNMAHFKNATYDELYVKQRQEPDTTKRAQYIKEMALILKEEAASLWVLQAAAFATIAAKFENFPQDASSFEDFRTTWDGSLEAPPEPLPVEIIAAVVIAIVVVAGVGIYWLRRKK